MAFGRIGIIGAGAWGTALAVAAHRAGREVILQAHEPEVAAAIDGRHENPFLAGIHLAPEIRATTRLAEAVAADAVLLVVPAQFLRGVCAQAAPHWPAGVPAVVCAKGIEQGTGALMTEAAAAALPQAPLAVLSGPSFAAEVARGLPSAVTLAAPDVELAKSLSAALTTPTFRVYASDDPVGAQLGGAVKNVLAIGCGIVEGRGLGDNARAALITRGLAEIMHLGVALGARATTFMGLSGLGDLVLTCNAMQSRNFSLGVALGEGRPLAEILGERKSVAEGVYTAASVMALADRHGVDMPICGAVDAVLNRGIGLDEAIRDLLARPVGEEFKGDT
jgi:glycerol-3-phosphate dehydrogenase (NAD(P)+)